MSVSLMVSGAGAIGGAAYLGLKDNQSSKEQTAAVALTTLFTAAFLMEGCALATGANFSFDNLVVDKGRFKPLELSGRPLHEFERVTPENLGSVWLEGDFDALIVFSDTGDHLRLGASRHYLADIKVAGQTHQKVAWDGWCLHFKGDDLVKLREEWAQWGKLDLLRPIERVGDQMTFKHLRSESVFTATVDRLADQTANQWKIVW